MSGPTLHLLKGLAFHRRYSGDGKVKEIRYLVQGVRTGVVSEIHPKAVVMFGTVYIPVVVLRQRLRPFS